jgi:uncharacterized protein (DUF1501 family)
MLDPDISTADALRHLSVTERDPSAIDRRRFLQLIGMGVGAGVIASHGGSLLNLDLPGLDPSVWAAGPIGANDGILIVLGMFGGNDGLNTVVPFNDGNYRTQHGSLAIPGSSTLLLDADTGLNPALTELERFWDAGQLAIVEGVGYPDPDLSHFSSMAKWMAGRPTGVPSTGWLGRWLDGRLAGGKDLFAAAEIGQSVPLHLIGQQQQGTAVPAGRPGFGANADARSQKIYTAVRRLGVGDPSTWRGRVGQAMIDQLDVAGTLAPLIPPDDQMSDTELVADMEVMARLINANLGFRVLTAGWGDFDSHAGQPNQHAMRMRELNAAIGRFFQVLDPAWGTRVTIMTFSEFGRTSWSNDGSGTDHGTSAPHFVLGANVRGGFRGQRPSLAGLRRWDRMPFHVDFRDYYGSIIDGWLGGGGSDVLGRPVQDLSLFARGPGVAGATVPAVVPVVVPPGAGGAGDSAATTGQFVALSPVRICDTRNGVDGRRVPIAAGETMTVQITGVGAVPVDGVVAVAVNVTSVNATQPTYLTVFPSGTALPASSTLNPVPGRAVANTTMVGVGADGRIAIFNPFGAVDCIVDVMGYFRPQPSTRLVPLVPSRLLDTRNAIGAPLGRVRGPGTIDLQVTGRGGVPDSGAQAVVLNVTAVQPVSGGYVSVWPSGEAQPVISNLNYDARRNVANLVVCKLGAGGRVSFFVDSGDLDLLADVVGYFAPDGAGLVAIAPARLLDTRNAIGAPGNGVGPGSEIALAVAGVGGVAPTARAVVLNVTATDATTDTFVTVYPDGVARPEASNLNVSAGDAIANLVVAKLGDNGQVRLFNSAGSLDLIADVTGYFI